MDSSRSASRAVTSRLVVAAATDPGLVRRSNEDAHVVCVVGGEPTDGGTFDTEKPLLMAVSDGMGGAAAGEVASALVVDALRRHLPHDSEDWGSSLELAVERANREVWTAGRDPQRRGMGATLTAVCVHGEDAHVAEVGDSRAYLMRDDELRLLTHDQSFVQMLLDSGAITPAEATHSPLKSVLLAAMGEKPDVSVDVSSVELRPGDRLLICCDGLSNELTAPEIHALVASSATPAEACTRLIAAANDHGGKDNITVIVAARDA